MGPFPTFARDACGPAAWRRPTAECVAIRRSPIPSRTFLGLLTRICPAFYQETPPQPFSPRQIEISLDALSAHHRRHRVAVLTRDHPAVALRHSPAATSAAWQRRGGWLLQQPARRQIRALAQRAELLPHHLLGDVGHAGGGLEAAVGAGDEAAGVADRVRRALDAVGPPPRGARRS